MDDHHVLYVGNYIEGCVLDQKSALRYNQGKTTNIQERPQIKSKQTSSIAKRITDFPSLR